ncbi:MAG: type I DNA topoisomerase, partial [Candidatus Levybacteria bacterium]|nr:type I DNA topoisomerase [Candidatus Levybacteria bacterium]
MKTLVIVESPTKAKTIGRFLGEDYIIKASMGHLMDLPKSTLAVDVEHNFKPQFELVLDKKKIIDDLKKAAKTVSSIILATDPDREGEAIAAHVAEILKKSDTKRIVFHEITREAIEEALNNPRSIDENLVDAQTARRVLDRLVGYKLSPLLWQKVRRGLSAGRVQSVALRLIVEREREIEKFKKEEYFTINVILRHDKEGGTEFELIEINGEKIEVSQIFNLYDGEYKVSKTTIGKEEAAQKITEDLKTKEFKVADVVQKEMRRSPAPPYTTSTLQQDASRRLGLNGKRTMSLAQKLYEEGYITYHRTDSVSIALSAQKMIVDYVKKEFGEKYLPEKPRFYATKQKLAQEAHEAIRPTKAGV